MTMTAFETNAERYRRRVFSFARSLLSNHEEAEEAAEVRSVEPDPEALVQATDFRRRLKEALETMFLRFDAQEKLSNLYVVALDPAELTLIRLDGHLDRAMAESIADHPKEMVKEVGGGEDEKGAL